MIINKYAEFIIRHRKAVIIIFTVAIIISAVMIFGVKQNYKMSDYLPDDAQSTVALGIMRDEFGGSLPNAKVMVSGVSITEAAMYKKSIADISGVNAVMWLDDVADIKIPVSALDAATVDGYYRDGAALYTVTIADGEESTAIDAIRGLGGDGVAISVSGEAADIYAQQTASVSETVSAMIIVVIIILVLLVFFTDCWAEPLLFIAAVGAAIIINMGTNIFFDKISYITNMISPILQLAVSLDYAVFLLHSYNDGRHSGMTSDDAMKAAIKKSISSVAASALTTLCGFLALAFMDFKLGADLGINLTKGILLSFLSCVMFLPALTLTAVKLLDKTAHKRLLPSFSRTRRLLLRLALPVFIIVAVIIVPCYIAQGRVEFLYGSGGANEAGQGAEDNAAIEAVFGKSTEIVLLVPRGNPAAEALLSDELSALPHVTGVVSYTSSVGIIPPEFIGDIADTFYSDAHARIIVYTDTESEGDTAFATVENVIGLTEKYYEDDYNIAGQSASLYDMKNIVSADNTRVGIILLLSIFAVLLVTFKSAALPFLLLLTIEAGIWVNLAVPYFSGTPLNFIGYLIISTVQLGATVDYAILTASYYLSYRKCNDIRQALALTYADTFKSVLLSGTILSAAGFALYFSSSLSIVTELGMLLGRGTLLSMLMVYCLLPALLAVFDKPVGALTRKSEFFRKTDGTLPSSK